MNILTTDQLEDDLAILNGRDWNKVATLHSEVIASHILANARIEELEAELQVKKPVDGGEKCMLRESIDLYLYKILSKSGRFGNDEIAEITKALLRAIDLGYPNILNTKCEVD